MRTGCCGAGEHLTRVAALEIHRIFSRRQLEAGVNSLNDVAGRFAECRSFDVALIPAAEQPSAAEAFEEVKDRARAVSSIGKKTMSGAAQVAKDKLHRDRSPDEDPALGPGESMEALGAGDPTDVTGPDLLEAAGPPESPDESEAKVSRFRRKPRADQPAPPPF